MNKTAAIAIFMAVSASGATAQNFSGNLGFSYATPTDTDDLSVTEYFGGIEYAISRKFSVALDLAGYSFEDVDAAFVSSTLHFIYHLDQSTSIALFSSGDVIAADTEIGTVTGDVGIAGIEAGREFGVAKGEGYLGFGAIEDSDDGFAVFGVSGAYAISNGLSAVGSLDVMRSDFLDTSNVAIGVEYEIAGGPELYGKLGRRAAELDSGDDGASTYVEIGASVNFGRARGTTFERRSFFETLPNF